MRLLSSGRNPNDFSLAALINSARIANEWEDGKYVVIPSRVHTVWLHWPGIMEPGYKMHTIPEEVNIMVHMRNWSMVRAPAAFESTSKFRLTTVRATILECNG